MASSSEKPPNLTGTRHETLYLPTGDLVLSALSTLKDRGIVLFRVHKFMMAHHSAIFRDMFAIPVPVEDCNKSYDGAHLAHMPDSAEDLEGLLGVLYDPTRLPHKCQEFEFVVVGILKLAIKYEIEPIRKHIVTQVNAAWPSTLQEWDASEKRSALMEESGVFSTDALLPEPVLCLEIAKQAPDDVHILPVAFYQLSRTSIHNNWGDTRTGKKTLRYARWDHLCKEDYMQLLRVREEWKNGITAAEKDLRSKTVEMTSCTSCPLVYDKIWQVVYSEIYKHNDAFRSFLILDRLGYEPADELCQECFFEYGEMFREMRLAFWEGWNNHF